MSSREAPLLTIEAWPLARLAAPVCPLTAIAPPERRLLRRSLRDGWLLPILVCPNGAIIDGATRVVIARADRQLREAPVPVVVHPGNWLTACTRRVRLHRGRGDVQILALLSLLDRIELTPAEARRRFGCLAPERRALLAARDLLPTDTDRA